MTHFLFASSLILLTTMIPHSLSSPFGLNAEVDCDQGSREWADVEEWKTSEGILDILKPTTPAPAPAPTGVMNLNQNVIHPLEAGKGPETTCKSPNGVCIGTFLFVKTGKKVFLYRGCPDEGKTKYLEGLLKKGAGARMSAAGTTEPSCGLASLGGSKGLMLSCDFQDGQVPAKVDAPCVPAFVEAVKEWEKNPATLPTEPWGCDKTPQLKQTCPLGTAEWENLDAWKESKGSWKIEKDLEDEGKTCTAIDDGTGHPFCIAFFVLPPQIKTGEKVFMFRGCQDKVTVKKFMEDKLEVPKDDGNKGRTLATGDTGSGCSLVMNKVKGFIMLYCMFKAESVPSDGDHVEEKCLNSFYEDAKKFRSDPSVFPKDGYECGKGPRNDKAKGGTPSGNYGRASMMTLILWGLGTMWI